MTEDDKDALVPRKGGGLIQTAGGGRVLSQMVEGALERVRSREKALREARFRVGAYEFREPDYRQILRWAEALDRSPESVVEVLKETQFKVLFWSQVVTMEVFSSDFFLPEYDPEERTVVFSVIDGYLSSIVWDFAQLPLDHFAWEEGLRIHTLVFEAKPPAGWLPTLPEGLQTLVCGYISLEELDLSGVPELTWLMCGGNQLTEMDLSGVPALTELWCGVNQLTELDLTGVPELTRLDCSDNELTELDLSAVPQLEMLECGGNKLAELDIRSLGHLARLTVDANVRIIGTPPEGCKVQRL